MKRKNPLSIAVLLLSALLLLTSSLMYVFAEPVSPYLMVLPEETSDSTLTPGSTYTISIVTDYDGIDIWAWSLELFFNPAVLEVLEVRNGDLITTAKHPDALFVPGTIDNPNGMLETTRAWIDYEYSPAPTTYGPGTLAYVDFNVTGYGTSDIEFSATAQQSSKLIDGFNDAIIDAFRDFEWNQIGYGYFSNLIPGDMTDDTPGVLPDAPDGDVDGFDLGAFADAYGTSEGDPDFDHLGDVTDDSPGVPPDLPDGDIDGFDLGVFADYYGTTLP